MIVVLGVGNSLHGDDGAGPATAAGVAALGLPGVAAYDCGTAPENFTGVVRRAAPDLLVIVDAAEMGLPAGSVRRIPAERICDTAIGTHMLALSHLVRFLADAAGRIVVVGVQPFWMGEREGLSAEVERGVAEVVRCVREGDLERIGVMG
ncbi:hydrogenase 3 maturation endopeptidase HyCI [Methanocorpusculum vombati]|uniref:Hydrogenase 3 maturation endopeptidase HyCI n=1 Tax=Methanocorpusculum vombati TaxID=3002864 RepID=A0ABT4IL24_9EURY|nr:hydrogenase 3 maturation endopeptidase HyCI [Methanocorpusculum vombati]MCZ0862460.1 hydrogenase 3 maturation endopeptidase HyCI [Methanocorpusculum vombati]